MNNDSPGWEREKKRVNKNISRHAVQKKESNCKEADGPWKGLLLYLPTYCPSFLPILNSAGLFQEHRYSLLTHSLVPDFSRKMFTPPVKQEFTNPLNYMQNFKYIHACTFSREKYQSFVRLSRKVLTHLQKNVSVN